MNVSSKRLNTLTDMSVQAAMSVLRAGLPEFPKVALDALKEEIHMHLSDTIESHIAGLTEDEARQVKEPKAF